MAVREITFTVTVRYNDAKIVNPGHLVGGMLDEIKGWGGSPEPYEVKVSDPTFESQEDYAFRQLVKLVAHQLDYAEGKTQQTSRAYGDQVMIMVQAAVEEYCELTGTDSLKAYMKAQGVAVTERNGLS